MTGVPSSRGCEQCRKQKKKCLAAVPPCPRCSRLQLQCLGLGQRRYKFVGQKRQSITPSKAIAAPSYGPHNDHTKLTSAFIDTLDPTTGIEFNILCNFGGFLTEIPCRLGSNAALDATSEAFVAAFCHFRTCRLGPTRQVLQQHGRAVNALRRCLEEPTTARAPETLCAVQLIMIYQTFLGKTEFVSHSSGIAQILRSRGSARPCNDFEEKLLLVQRGSVIFEALLNDKVHLTRREWSELVENKLDNNSLDCQLMRILARVPNLMQRARSAMTTEDVQNTDLQPLKTECQELYNKIQLILAAARAYLGKDDISLLSDYTGPPQRMTFVHAFRTRSYGFALMAAILIDCIARSLDNRGQDDSDHLRYFAQEIIELAKIAQVYRPLGSMYIIACLSAAYIATDDSTTQAMSADLLQDYRMDLSGPNTTPLKTELDWLKQRFMLKEIGTYEEVFHSYV